MKINEKSIILFLVLSLILFYTYVFFLVNHKTAIGGDGRGYYAYLPSIFIYHDLKYPNLEQYEPDRNLVAYPAFYQISSGAYLNKYPMGVAIMLLPAFLAAVLLSFLSGLPIDGYNPIFQYLIGISAPIYVSLGLFFCYRLYRKYFSSRVSLMTIITILLATNLLHYSVYEVTMSHAYTFSLMSLVIFLIDYWWREPKKIKTSLCLGLVMGLLFLTRNIHGSILIIWLFYGCFSIGSFCKQLALIFKNYKRLLTVIVIFILIASIQFGYQYWISGNFLLQTYQGEFFNWLDPAWYGVLFSPRKGWIFWHPIWYLLSLSIININKLKTWILGSGLYIIIFIYLVASWYAWWFGDSFGHRAFIDIYPILGLYLAASFSVMTNKRFRGIGYLVVGGLIIYNLILTRTYWKGGIPRDNNMVNTYFKLLN